MRDPHKAGGLTQVRGAEALPASKAAPCPVAAIAAKMGAVNTKIKAAPSPNDVELAYARSHYGR